MLVILEILMLIMIDELLLMINICIIIISK